MITLGPVGVTRKVLAFASAFVTLALSACGVSPVGTDMSASEVLRQLRAEGMPVGAVTDLTASTDPNELLGRPGQYTSKAFFVDTRLGATDKYGARREEADAGGSVEVFESEADAEKRSEYVQAISEGSGPFAEYSYQRGLIFLRLTKSMTPDQAKDYERALQGL